MQKFSIPPPFVTEYPEFLVPKFWQHHQTFKIWNPNFSWLYFCMNPSNKFQTPWFLSQEADNLEAKKSFPSKYQTWYVPWQAFGHGCLVQPDIWYTAASWFKKWQISALALYLFPSQEHFAPLCDCQIKLVLSQTCWVWLYVKAMIIIFPELTDWPQSDM